MIEFEYMRMASRSYSDLLLNIKSIACIVYLNKNQTQIV